MTLYTTDEYLYTTSTFHFYYGSKPLKTLVPLLLKIYRIAIFIGTFLNKHQFRRRYFINVGF